MDLRNLKKSLQAKSDQKCDSNSDLTSLAMSHLNSLPMNPFSQLNSVNMSQLLGKFGRSLFIEYFTFCDDLPLVNPAISFIGLFFGCPVNGVHVGLTFDHN